MEKSLRRQLTAIFCLRNGPSWSDFVSGNRDIRWPITSVEFEGSLSNLYAFKKVDFECIPLLSLKMLVRIPKEYGDAHSMGMPNGSNRPIHIHMRLP